MKHPHPLRSFPSIKIGGIYFIINKLNGKRYVGSTKDFKSRCRLHWWHLRKGEHHSAYLQNAWFKYGEGVFDFIILETMDDVSKQSLLDREDYYLKLLNPEYNMSPTSAVPLSSKEGLKRRIISRQKEYILTSPDGQVFDVKGLKGFCLEHGLEYKYMSAVIRGRQGHHRGWKGKKKDDPFPEYEYHQKKLKKLSKDGKIYEFRDARKFAAEHGMKYADVVNVLYGNAKQSHGFVLPREGI